MAFWRALSLAAAIALPPLVESSPYVISDDRVRSLDVTPVLGRGYSIATNSFQSTCLEVEETTSPSYNYEYYFTDFTSSEDSEATLQGSISNTFGYRSIKNTFNSEHKSTSKVNKEKQIVTATMRVERFYSSVREDKSEMSDHAKTLLDNNDYVGFFKACGPNYVRSIRRAQEVTAIFEFESSNKELAKEYARTFQTGAGRRVRVDRTSTVNNESKFNSMSKSLTITITGYGLGLNEEGSSTLVATTMDEFNEVMKFAFESMTQSPNGHNIGMVYGIELVPWVDNSAFQIAAKIDDAVVEIPLPRGVIPRAIPKDKADKDKVWGGTDATREKFRCKDDSAAIDKYGYCCRRGEMEEQRAEGSFNEDEDDNTFLENQICKPIRALEPTIKKNNMANNGEFVALLDSLVRYRLNNMFTLEKCITALSAIPTKYDSYYLKSKDTVKYDGSIEAKTTVAQLRMMLNPTNDYSLVRHLGQELDEFMAMYYQPCLADLFGLNLGGNSNTDPVFFMSEAWYNHESCTKLSCLADNMRWDRANGGCVPSLITGTTANDEYGNGDDKNGFCKKIISFGEEVCEKAGDGLKKLVRKMNNCWTPPATAQKFTNVPSPVYMMEHFCNPEITDDKLPKSDEDDFNLWKAACDADPAP